MNNILGAHIGHFRVVDRLGKGGMGEVYVGHDEVLDRKVALKCLRSDLHPTEETKLRFLREARVLSQLKHPNICQIFECFEAHGTVVLVLELIHGKGLHTVAHDLDIYQRLDLARQIAAALVAAH